MKNKPSKPENRSPQPLHEVILFALVVVSLVVGVHQTFLHGFWQSYWIFMFNITFLFLYSYIKGKRINKKHQSPSSKKSR